MIKLTPEQWQHLRRFIRDPHTIYEGDLKRVLVEQPTDIHSARAVLINELNEDRDRLNRELKDLKQKFEAQSHQNELLEQRNTNQAHVIRSLKEQLGKMTEQKAALHEIARSIMEMDT